MITLKIRYTVQESFKDTISNYQRQYNNLLHLFYNRLKEGISETACKHLEFNNLELMNSWFRQSCVKDASYLIKDSKDEVILFGGKKLFEQRFRKNISKEDFKEKKLVPFTSTGEGRCKGNRLFRLVESLDRVIFQPKSGTKISLNLIGVGKNRVSILRKLYRHQLSCDLPITYKLDKQYVYISFDEIILQEELVKPIENRVMSIDMNPNYMGYSILDWKDSEKFEIVKTGIISLKSLNDYDKSLKDRKLPSNSNDRVYTHNKRVYETLESSKYLIKLAKHYQCECFAIEDLNMKSKDLGYGRANNKLILNNWNRNKLSSNLEKRCKILGIKFLKVIPNYSSIIGNLVYRNLQLPDPILASIEISRRCYEFNLQYIMKIKNKTKNIVLPILESLKDKVKHSLEEVKCFIDFENWQELFSLLKKSKLKYRFPFDEKVFESKTLKLVNQFY